MDEILSEAGEEMEMGVTPEEGAVAGNFSPGTTRELLQDLMGDDWADSHHNLRISPYESGVASSQ